MLGDASSLFGAEGELDWMTQLSGEGIDFGQYLENLGDDNEGEASIA